MVASSTEAQERAEARRAKEEAAAQSAANARAEAHAETKAIDEKTARLRSLRLAKEASDASAEPEPQATKRKKKR